MEIQVERFVSSRRAFLIGALGGTAFAAVPGLGWAASGRHSVAEPAAAPQFLEHRVPRGANTIYARQYVGKGPTLVMLHGFPDNLHIYDGIAPIMAASGKNIVAFDYMGFGASDKPAGYAYSFDQQKADIEAVVDYFKLDNVVPVAHDAGGVSALNYALDHPDKISSIVLLNTFYADAPNLKFPELIELCADPGLKKLAVAIMSDKKKREWLLTFQNHNFNAKSTPAIQARFDTVLQPIVNANFAQKESAGPAFMAMTGGLHPAVAANDKRVADLVKLKVPVSIIWGANDPYLNTDVAADFGKQFPGSKTSLLPLGHWPQVDDPQAVADIMNRELKA
ncbi:alpha/beta hydrolase [Mesorhizobium sp. B2-1-8]|uniref:alpha/beta fold hydrolase n=1 Tax=Mesorhizobium sp. B2-1-8 TaxID=2589967 RepID=UPI00112CCE76|nr:alpha/beta hydrolase [Mesorhizobium sp. B2-1-8]UCI17908.1 alpha/beta hydrolase [Mesorhizobium sp. B2-1-8]